MKKTVRVVLIAAAVLIVLAAAVLAAGEAALPGSEGDPLVTLSYINNVFTDYVKELFRNALNEKSRTVTESLESRLSALESAAAANGESRTFEPVTLSDGAVLVCREGAEVLLREGGAAADSASALLDMGGGEAPAEGASLGTNRLYLITADGCGIRAKGKTELLVRGEYEIK